MLRIEKSYLGGENCKLAVLLFLGKQAICGRLMALEWPLMAANQSLTLGPDGRGGVGRWKERGGGGGECKHRNLYPHSSG
jgi:hypothetical protein